MSVIALTWKDDLLADQFVFNLTDVPVIAQLLPNCSKLSTALSTDFVSNLWAAAQTTFADYGKGNAHFQIPQNLRCAQQINIGMQRSGVAGFRHRQRRRTPHKNRHFHFRMQAAT